jgi:hypothetical protein
MCVSAIEALEILQFKKSSLALVTIGTFGQNCKIGNSLRIGNVVFGNV